MSALDLANFLNTRAKELHLSATTISKTVGISRQTWYRLLNADIQQARIETLMRVAEVLQVNLMELSSLYTNQLTRSQKASVPVGQSNDACSFIRDITYPLNAMVKGQQAFEKKWEIINLGSTPWVNRRLICVDEAFEMHLKRRDNGLLIREQTHRLKPHQASVAIPLTAPGEHVILSASFYAPKMSGTVISFWKMINAQGEYCFPSNTGLSCQVRVVQGMGKMTKSTMRVA
jgi:DNA-binding XRE family transcriptional regulator